MFVCMGVCVYTHLLKHTYSSFKTIKINTADHIKGQLSIVKKNPFNYT